MMLIKNARATAPRMTAGMMIQGVIRNAMLLDWVTDFFFLCRNPISAVHIVVCAEQGASLEQRRHALGSRMPDSKSKYLRI
jgi:hypothetical protein